MNYFELFCCILTVLITLLIVKLVSLAIMYLYSFSFMEITFYDQEHPMVLHSWSECSVVRIIDKKSLHT